MRLYLSVTHWKWPHTYITCWTPASAHAPWDLTFVLYKMDEYESVSDRRRRLTRQRVQRHRGRTDEARRETARAADRKRLGRQNEVDVRRSQRFAITRGYVLKLPNCIKASREASLRGQPNLYLQILIVYKNTVNWWCRRPGNKAMHAVIAD